MAKGRRLGGARRTARKGAFDPDDVARVQHTRVGVWDLYEERHPKLIWRLPGFTTVEHYADMLQNIPYSGQLLTIVQEAIDTRMVDEQHLLRISAARVCCSIAKRFLSYFRSRLSYTLNARLKQHFSVHLFHARARLDLPTFEDPAVQRQLEQASSTSGHSSIAWDTVSMVVGAGATAVQLVSQLSVLANVLRGQDDGPLLAVLSLAQSVFEWRHTHQTYSSYEKVWAATTKNADYIRMQGLKRVVNDVEHRKEFIAGNLAEYTTKVFKEAVSRVGQDAGDYWELQRSRRMRDRLNLSSIIQDPLRELPQIVFTFRAVQRPTSIPVSLASLNLIQQTTANFSWTVYHFFDQFGSIAEQMATVRKLYDVEFIPNRIVDGNLPYPEDAQKVKSGITVEFKNVSFKYPGSDDWAVHDVSFKLVSGQLCVIVGVNGSGKSTVLKLIARLYDPQEGEIFIDGLNIKTLKLADLRQAMSVLFQDYTHFPLSVRENIALGNPAHAADDTHIRRAAALGGAEGFIERLPDGFDTYLERPVRDYYSGIPEGTQTLFGRKVDFSAVRGIGGFAPTQGTSLSGGQMQRLAVSRTFMRSVVAEDSPVGLLLFDEPSASLDPSAEHDLFARLRELRGNKTMLFSSHRFGNLTRHADVILYMDDSRIVEAGTHDALLTRDGEYARIWKLQAQAFL